MNTYEFIENILQAKKEKLGTIAVDETSAYETAQLVSGSFIYPLYGTLWQFDFDMTAITEHLEYLYDSGNHFGLIYFIFILADAAEFTLPLIFSETSAVDELVPILSAAIIEDWLDYDATSEVVETE
ncbi:MAG: hypothetical protein LBB91_07025 [Clostridiales bacterium]|jgi:hypothetical protein|nr:hypothetical protein [Clostridiales bacterium]